MSAQDDFWTWINEHDADNAAPLGLLLSAVLREHAHELAERQRDAAHIVRLVGLEAEDAVRVSAALIDPEASDG